MGDPGKTAAPAWRPAGATSHPGARRSSPGAWRASGSAWSKPRAVGALLTVLLHLLILVALLHVTTSIVAPPRPTAAQDIDADRLRDAGELIVSVDVLPGPSAGGMACRGTYVGVGITADPRTQRIIMVGDDTPASRAGLQRDDIVLNPDVWLDAHRDGVLLRVLVLRDGVKTIVPVRVGLICIG